MLRSFGEGRGDSPRLPSPVVRITFQPLPVAMKYYCRDARPQELSRELAEEKRRVAHAARKLEQSNMTCNELRESLALAQDTVRPEGRRRGKGGRGGEGEGRVVQCSARAASFGPPLCFVSRCPFLGEFCFPHRFPSALDLLRGLSPPFYPRRVCPVSQVIKTREHEMAWAKSTASEMSLRTEICALKDEHSSVSGELSVLRKRCGVLQRENTELGERSARCLWELRHPREEFYKTRGDILFVLLSSIYPP